MTVYNVNLGIGWASSGVEYAQSYRAAIFRQLHIPAKFIFSDLVLDNNIEKYTSNLGFSDDQIIWFYNYFTDLKIAPSTFPLTKFEEQAELKKRHFDKKNANPELIQYMNNDEGLLINVHLADSKKQSVWSVDYISKNLMVKREFYSYTKYCTEYFNGDPKANMVSFREFFNEDGSVAYTDHLNGKDELFEFPDNLYYSKNELYLRMIKELNFQKDDTIILDRMDDGGILINGQLFFENYQPAKLVIVVHADHFDAHNTDNYHVLWNNFYEYQFTHTDDVAAYVVATDKQNEVFTSQEKKYQHRDVNTVTIPVGNLAKLTKPDEKRKPYSMITASRLADEKHIDWLVRATAIAHDTVPGITLDIYGFGPQLNNLRRLVKDLHAEDYIQLKGQQDLTDVYKHYSAYVAGSTSEGFGLSLMEAVGSGLPIVGFDVPYGNQTFIDDGKNGHLLPYDETSPIEHKVNELSKAMVTLFTKDNLKAFHKHSYEVAQAYLQENVAKNWQQLLEELHND